MNRVKINGFEQNCFRVDGVHNIHVEQRKFKQDKYLSLEKVDLPNGFIQQLVEKDYPINEDSVSSLAEGADYRRDPLQAIANAPTRVNLGDIVEAQRFLENPQNYAHIFDTVKKDLIKYYEAQKQKDSAPAVEEKTEKDGENK